MSPVSEDGLTDLCTPCVIETLLRNSRVHLDLTLNHILDFSEIYGICILEKTLKTHLVAICAYDTLRCFFLDLMLYVTKNLLILRHINDVCVMVSDTYTSRMLFRFHDDLDIEIWNIL